MAFLVSQRHKWLVDTVEDMSWRTPQSLQRCAALGVCRHLIHATEQRVRRAISLVPAELLIARATADLLVRDEDEESDTDDENEKWESIAEMIKLDRDGSPPEEVDVMDFALLHVKVRHTHTARMRMIT